MWDHEATVQPSIPDEEGGQLTEGRVHQPLNPPLAHIGQLVHTYSQVVQGLEQRSHTQSKTLSEDDKPMWKEVRTEVCNFVSLHLVPCKGCQQGMKHCQTKTQFTSTELPTLVSSPLHIVSANSNTDRIVKDKGRHISV